MRAQKMREEAIEKERDEHFNTIQLVIPMKQKWRVKEKEKANDPAPMTSDDDMNLLDDDEAPWIKDGSPSLTGMNINMMFTLSAEFRGVEEEVDVSPPQVGRVLEAHRVKPALETIVHSRPHRREADLQDACQQQRCRQPDVVHRV
jgi:hypothetical protein